MTHLGGIRRSFPTFRLLTAPFRWVGKSRRRVMCVVLMLLSIVTAPPLWWAIQLAGLPDIGEPFDVEALRAQAISDDRNAFVLYLRAVTLYRPLKWSDTSGSLPVDLHTRWSAAAPEVRRWAELNHEALALYRRGADRPDALDSSLTTMGGFVAFDALRPFQRLALLEASRLEAQGDMAGAWGWYRTYLRTIHHVGSYGMLYRRMAAQAWHDQLRIRTTDWAADARTSPAQLYQALDDVVACEAIVPSDSYTLKAHYLFMTQGTDGSDDPGRQMPPPWLGAIKSLALDLTPEQVRSISNAWRFWRREPERCRRLIRLVTANRLAFYDLPPDRRPSPDPDVLSCAFYPFGPEAPAEARVLSPKALGRWLDSTQEPRRLIGSFNWRGLRVKERANHRELVILLGIQLYRRDHGTDPPTPEALVGPYLKSLPMEYPDEVRDEANPRAATTVD
jgi:hypothetical protein